jgi:hypothetical protein
VFDMKIVGRSGRKNVFLTDGYMNLALLSQKAEGKPNGLNHFGFVVEDTEEVARRMQKWDVVGPEKRPADRVYAETRGTDPEGNNFDLSEAGFDRDIAPEKRAKDPITA